ncbi:hypothetical protein KL930_002859 [Ogataea haglerorum]|uniref:Uncharacterized protein n=1 Tax=Ogataea haglerorum TaxID=1937702 RepID=A0ABQ7RH54_9ASCO|nr:hypothetical protein KL950_004173 [Ogataea haglerorum]KAG7739428.1 hypothetical protein KL932_003522 [Ogataea haglerorum]KAG7756107.1 hypothetical protein KL947_003713 [Ogataea haglerorum]KAG7765387.1 hypothetical protein KL946_002444 [Ogataea haglerorum]KAG7777185.1 hypothetical protein KL930_002859 [Ogataea haglerorum]
MFKVASRKSFTFRPFTRPWVIRNSSSASNAPESAPEHAVDQDSSGDVQRTKKSRKNYISTFPRVPSTNNIREKDLLLEQFFNGHLPLTKPIEHNHPATPSLSFSPNAYKRSKVQNSSILDNLKKYKDMKRKKLDDNYHPFYSAHKKSQSAGILTHSSLDTQEHNLEMLNLPTSYLQSLKPFKAPPSPGNEAYRDDIIYVRKLEIEERNLKQQEEINRRVQENFELAKRGLKQLDKGDIGEFLDAIKLLFTIPSKRKKSTRTLVPNTGHDEPESPGAGPQSSDDDEYDDFFEEEYTFDFDFSHQVVNFDPVKVHSALFKLLRIQNPKRSSKYDHWLLFASLAGFCDVYTQPSDMDYDYQHVLSLKRIADAVIALNYNTHSRSETPRFDLAFALANIVEKITVLLNCSDYQRLAKVNNDDTHWEENLHLWTPHKTLSGITSLADGFHDLKLLYNIATVAVYCIYLLYKKDGYRSANGPYNPFADFFFQLWENITQVIIYGLEIDRRDEKLNFPGYPPIVRQVIKGCAALRSITAAAITAEDDRYEHDLQHSSLFTFMRPLGRRAITGSLAKQNEIHTLPARVGSIDFENLPLKLILNDRYDEDVMYMFELGLARDVKDDPYLAHHPDNDSDFDIDCEFHPSCPCDVDRRRQQQDIIQSLGDPIKGTQREKDPLLPDNILQPHYSPIPLQFDELGNDLREIPRGPNTQLTDEFVELLHRSQEDVDIFFTSPDELLDHLDYVFDDTDRVCPCEKVVRSVAWIVMYEYEASLMTEDELLQKENDPAISTEELINVVCDSVNYKVLVKRNPNLYFAMMDELLMTPGARLKLLRHLCMQQYHHWQVTYLHDLLIGERGKKQNDKNSPLGRTEYPFSRKGPLILTDYEKSVVVDTFLSNQFDQLKQVGDDKDSYEIPLKVICIMLKSLKVKGVCVRNIQKFRIELQSWLIQSGGLGKFPEARELFFDSQNETLVVEEEPKRLNTDLHRISEVEQDGPKLGALLLLKLFKDEGTVLLDLLLNFGHYYPKKRPEILFFLSDLDKLEDTFNSQMQLVTISDYVFMYIWRALQCQDANAIRNMLLWTRLIDENYDCLPKIQDFINHKFENAPDRLIK